MKKLSILLLILCLGISPLISAENDPARQKLEEAIAAYEKSIQLFPEAIAPLINQSSAYNLLDQKELALNRLYRALEIDPENEATHLNFAMLMGEMGRLEEAESSMRKVLEINPASAQAAYNLSVMLAERKPEESLEMSKKAMELDPSQAKYAYTCAFYLIRADQKVEGQTILEETTSQFPDYADAWLLLGTVFEQKNDSIKAKTIYEKALKTGSFGEEDQARIQQKIDSMQ